MTKNVTWRGRDGFTLIEVLVTLILLAVLAAAVFPVVTRQSDSADPVRVSSDLSALRAGIEAYRLDVRPNWPGDLEDLVHAPQATGDPSLNRDDITNSVKWNGPYLDVPLVENHAGVATGDAMPTAYDAQIQNELVCLSAGVAEVDLATTECVAGNAVALKIADINELQARALEEIIDNGTGAAFNTTGKFRRDTGATATSYYVLGTFF